MRRLEYTAFSWLFLGERPKPPTLAAMAVMIVAIAITRIPASNRVVRAVTLATKHLDFVEAARVSGAQPWRVMLAIVVMVRPSPLFSTS